MIIHTQVLQKLNGIQILMSKLDTEAAVGAVLVVMMVVVVKGVVDIRPPDVALILPLVLQSDLIHTLGTGTNMLMKSNMIYKHGEWNKLTPVKKSQLQVEKKLTR
jgi:hypothetical protein